MMSEKQIEDKLSSKDFDMNAYIKDVAYKYDNSEDLRRHKKQIQGVAEKTAKKLKQNVYQNYALFIDTSREISSLEAEMYQLSHLLNEHQVLTSSIQALHSEGEVEEQPTQITVPHEKHSISSLLETVEGCSTVTEVPGRYLVHSSHLAELDPQTHEIVQHIQAFLLNDSLMLASINKHRRKGPVKYQFQALYELDNLAVVNVRDTEKTKFVFEIRMFPDNHMFQARNDGGKKEWIRQLELTKQKMVVERDSARNVESQMQRAMGSRRDRQGKGMRAFVRQSTEVASPDWIKDTPENLDVYIAQRDFKKAVELIKRVKNHLKDSGDHITLRNVRVRVNHRTNLLAEVLMKDLLSSPTGSLRGGPRAARRAVSFLIELGRAAKACELFLKNHSYIIEHELRQIKLEGATTVYINNVSVAFFCCLHNAAKEFESAFQDNTGTYSVFVTWSVEEVERFLNNYCIESIFSPVKSNTNITTVADCVSTIVKNCETLRETGLDLGFKVMSLLREPLQQALVDSRELLEDKLVTLGAADNWEPMDCRKNEARIAEIILQLENIGVPSPSNLVVDKIVDLSKTTFESCQGILNYVESFLKIYTPELLEPFLDCLSDIFRRIVLILVAALNDNTFLPQTDFLLKNAELLIRSALPALTLKIQKQIEQEVPKFVDLQQELLQLISLVQEGRRGSTRSSAERDVADDNASDESSPKGSDDDDNLV